LKLADSSLVLRPHTVCLPVCLSVSDDEWNDSFASAWVVLELSPVRLVFAERPLSHLSEADQCKQQRYVCT